MKISWIFVVVACTLATTPGLCKAQFGFGSGRSGSIRDAIRSTAPSFPGSGMPGPSFPRPSFPSPPGGIGGPRLPGPDFSRPDFSRPGIPRPVMPLPSPVRPNPVRPNPVRPGIGIGIGPIIGIPPVSGPVVGRPPRESQPIRVQPAPVYNPPVYTQPTPAPTIVYESPASSASVNSIVQSGPTVVSERVVASVSQGSDARSLADQAQRLFREKKYEEAAELLDRVVELAERDSNAYQFRALAHFAAENYDDASADVYDALLYGNTWDWQAVWEIYQSKEVYEAHLRRLEIAQKKSPSMSNHFLLGYHYLVLNHLKQGQRQLEMALEKQPGEPLISQLVAVVAELQAAEQP